MKNQQKFKSCIATVTAVACLATGMTGMTASAINVSQTVINTTQTNEYALSEAVYTFKDTDINLVLPSAKFNSVLKKYSYNTTNVAGNKTSVGFSLTTTKDFRYSKVTVTDRVVCNSILGEMYEAGFTTFFAEVHKNSETYNRVIPVQIIKHNENYTPQIVIDDTSNQISYAIPVDFNALVDTSSTTKFYEIKSGSGTTGQKSLTSLFTVNQNCKTLMYERKPITYVNDPSFLISLFDLEDEVDLYTYTVDSTGTVSNMSKQKINICYGHSYLDKFTLTDSFSNNMYIYKGGYAAALNSSINYTDFKWKLKQEYFDKANKKEDGTTIIPVENNVGTFLSYPDDEKINEKGVYILGYTPVSSAFSLGFDILNSQYSWDIIPDMIEKYGISEYYEELGLINSVTDKNLTKYDNFLNYKGKVDNLIEDDGTIDVDKNFWIISDKLNDNANSSFDNSEEGVNDKYMTGIQNLYTSEGDYKSWVVSRYVDDEFVVDANNFVSEDKAKALFDTSTSDYFVEFVAGKMAFITHDADYKLTAKDTKGELTIQNVREVSAEYLKGDGSYNILSEEKRDCVDEGAAVNVTTEADSEKKLFLPDFNYELADGTDLVRIHLMYFSETDTFKQYSDEGESSGILYFYDSSYDSPSEAYEAGADCYAVEDGNYDILLPTGNYKISSIIEIDRNGDGKIDTIQSDIGSFTDKYRDVDLDNLDKNKTVDFEWATGKSSEETLELVYNIPMQEVDLNSYISNAGKIGGIESIELVEGETLPEGIAFENGVISGTPKEIGTKTAEFEYTAGNGNQIELTITFNIAKGKPSDLDIKIEEKSDGFFEGDELPKLIVEDSNPKGTVAWVVEEIKKLTAGENNLTWEFTPDDDNYEKVTGTAVIYAQTTTTTVTTTTVATTTTTKPLEVSLWGDVNVDGKVDVADAVNLNKYLVGSAKVTEQGLLNADCYNDKKVNSSDTLIILKLLVMTYTQKDLPIKAE